MPARKARKRKPQSGCTADAPNGKTSQLKHIAVVDVVAIRNAGCHSAGPGGSRGAGRFQAATKRDGWNSWKISLHADIKSLIRQKDRRYATVSELMHWIIKRLIFDGWIAAIAALVLAPESAPASTGAAKTLHPDDPLQFEMKSRIPWTNSHLTGSAEPPLPYKVRRVFPRLQFQEPIDLLSASSLGRLFIAERTGKVFSSANDDQVTEPDLAIDLAKEVPEFTQLYGMTVDPGFATNRFIFLCYVLRDGVADGTHLSRFKLSAGDPPRIDARSEEIVLTWLSGGHNGGCLKFGPEGYLYISTGDGRGPDPPDPLDAGQDISRPLSGILRIDVNGKEGGKHYGVPADNPFIHTAGACPEKWAYGLRNPWKMSFDQETGALWVGDVGYETWEMIYRIERGGNYGWSIVEGPKPIKPNGKRGPTPILPPVISHPHTEAACIIGGYVYHGRRLAGLQGAYIYGDWVTGKIWGLRYDGRQVNWQRELASSRMQLICFAEDPSAELFIVDYGGGIHRLEPNPVRDDSSSFPRKLSETGLFVSTTDHTLAPGVIPFSVNAQMWSDNARAQRFIALPDNSQIVKSSDARNPAWRFPTNAVLAKTLSLEGKDGQAHNLRRVETQILLCDGAAWHAYTYQWNDDQSDAVLVDAAGGQHDYEITEPGVSGGHCRETWYFSSRAECLRCHNPAAGPPLAFNSLELDRDCCYSASSSSGMGGDRGPGLTTKKTAATGRTENQIRAFQRIGVLSEPVLDAPVMKLTNPDDANCDLNERARSWLHVNCAHCHRAATGGAVASVFNYDQKLSESRTINFPPSQGTFGIAGAHVLTPGDPLRSVLYYRICTLGPAHMPRIGSRSVSQAGIDLIYDWIKQMPAQPAANDFQAAFPDPNEKQIQQWLDLLAGKSISFKARAQIIGRLLLSPAGAIALMHEIDKKSLFPAVRTEAIRYGTSHTNNFVRDLFERFVPPEKRVKRLGPAFAANEVLELHGDAARGRNIFFAEGGANCVLCHRADGRGRDFGPDLSHIGRKYDRAQLLDNILNPSKTIAPGFATYLVDTTSDLSYSGLLVRESPSEVVIKDTSLSETRIRRSDIARLQPSKISAMPEGLLQNLTAQEAADLLDFLSSLR
jgi:putative heme-binding domain-containing protein